MRWLIAVLIAATAVVGCGDAFGCSDTDPWPNRPGCEPVGTTITIVSECEPPETGCTMTRFFDEVGESTFFEIGMP